MIQDLLSWFAILVGGTLAGLIAVVYWNEIR